MNFASSEFKVGVLVVAIATLIGGMSLKVADGPGFMSGSKEFHFDLEDAGGLVPNSGVKMAGIQIGVIDRIKLHEGKARVYVTLDGDVPIKSTSLVQIKSDGILGDKHVEIKPGKLEDTTMAEEGSSLPMAAGSSSLDDLIQKIGRVADNLDKATSGDGDPNSPLGRIVLNIETLTQSLAEVSAGNKEKLNEVIANVHRITGTLDKFFDQQNPEGFQPAWARLSHSIENLDKTMEDVREVARKVNDGEGTVGRLINDEETVEGINTAINNVNQFFGGVSTLQLSLDYHGEYLFDSDNTQNFVGVRVKPGHDRYYYLGIVDTPEGVIQERIEDGVTRTTQFKNQVKFTAYFAKNFYNFTFKGGIFQDRGGFAIDYAIWKERFKLSMEVFDFGNDDDDRDAYLRTFVRFNAFKGVYVVAGVNDLLNDTDSLFVGAGLFLTNDDLRLLLATMTAR